jgi:5-methylcytosine-specific restriction endonuclease McrA
MTGWNRRGSSTAWRQLRARVLDRDGWRCRVVVDDTNGLPVPDAVARLGNALDLDVEGWRLCGEFADTVGHLDPRATGGPLLAHPTRLRAECRRHNYGDGARLGNLLRRARRVGDRGWSW